MSKRGKLPPEDQQPNDSRREENSPKLPPVVEEDPLLALRGSGKELWADEHTDEYVKHLREGWA